LTFKALGKSVFGSLFREHVSATKDIQGRLTVVENSIDQLYRDFMTKSGFEDPNYNFNAQNNLPE